MRIFLSLFLLLISVVAIAATENHSTPPGFEADMSKPTPEVNVEPKQLDTTPASHQSQTAWGNYDKPIRECIPGDTILPSENNKILNYLFENDANTDATLSR